MKRILISLCCLVLASGFAFANDMEDAFQKVKTGFEQRQKEAQKDLKQYLVDYPYTTYRSEVNLMIGVLQTEKGKYKNALRQFAKVEVNDLSRPQQPEYYFYKGYSLLLYGETAQAAACFKKLKDTENPYTLQGRYYYAYCSYKEGNYNRALPEFLAIEHTAEYKLVVPYYIVQIYYAQRNYDEVFDRAAYLLRENPDSEYTGEIHRIMGEIYYTQGYYLPAVEHLKAYEEDFSRQHKELVREDIYLLGVAEYQLEHWDSAVNYLKKVRLEQDTLSESTCYHLGNAYVKTNDIERAKLSYQAAIAYNLTPSIREEAMFNYALATYQSGTALGESISAFDAFLAAYPRSQHIEQVYELLADMYRNSKNYAMALESLDRIQNPTAKMSEAKQYLRYQLGADAFLQGKMPQVLDWMQQVIDHEPRSSAYKTEAYYYRAEAMYRLHRYEDCYNELRLYEQQPDAGTSQNNLQAVYLKGYALFSMKQYGEAEIVFRKYISRNADTLSPTYADAVNRIGDCCFNNRAFSEAAAMYNRVIELGKSGADYALFQRGYALGLMRNYSEKAQVLEQLVKSYPRSDYADDALYEIARARLEEDKNQAAINAYQRLIDNYPNSSYARKAALEIGMIYRNLDQSEAAIQAFKNTIKSYPGSEEAYAALDGLEQIYVETNRIGDYLAYTQQLGPMNMNVSSQEDSLTYVTAELQYMLGNYAEAAAGFGTYLSQYCQGGRYCTMATYYAADANYRLDRRQEALRLYQSLSRLDGNPYMEDAYVHMAQINYDLEDYAEARIDFEKMLELCTAKQQLIAARLGILRCSYFLTDYDRTISIATQILSEKDISEDVRNEALYNRAKAYLEGEQYGLAQIDFTPLSKDVRIETGAESKYWLAYCYYKLGNPDKAEAEVMSFASLNTQHQYWLAKSLLLLADINVQRGDLFQAKQYLLTLQSNYHGSDDILTLVAERLDVLSRLEQPNTDNSNEEED
ncbi:MAG: tetratricopeptide repeat protein [Paludibacteraceae bacterium]|nr:tetratricopeptide repeat protein [Paludibacteraceae bacterium]